MEPKGVVAASSQQWVSVKDDPPVDSNKNKILFYTNNGEICVGFVHKNGLWQSHDRVFPSECVTHWQPLPKPPKEADHES